MENIKTLFSEAVKQDGTNIYWVRDSVFEAAFEEFSSTYHHLYSPLGNLESLELTIDQVKRDFISNEVRSPEILVLGKSEYKKLSYLGRIKRIPPSLLFIEEIDLKNVKETYDNIEVVKSNEQRCLKFY